MRGKSHKLDNQTIKISGIIDKTNAKTTKEGKRIAGEVWFHPYLFLDFAMWLNPKFKLSVIKFVYDQLIEFRHNAGDNYRTLASAVVEYKMGKEKEIDVKANYSFPEMDLKYKSMGESYNKLLDKAVKFFESIDVKKKDENGLHIVFEPGTVTYTIGDCQYLHNSNYKMQITKIGNDFRDILCFEKKTEKVTKWAPINDNDLPF